MEMLIQPLITPHQRVGRGSPFMLFISNKQLWESPVEMKHTHTQKPQSPFMGIFGLSPHES